MNPYEPPAVIEKENKPSWIYKQYLKWFYPKLYCKKFGHNWDEDQGWYKINSVWNCYTCGAKKIDCG